MKPQSFFTFLLTGAGALAQESSTASRKCRCLYNQPCWPNEREFASLSAKLSQPLLHPIPPASTCYPVDHPSGNCTDTQVNWIDGNWRADIPGAYQNINFETYMNENGTIDGCYLNTSLGLPCKQGNIPPVGVDARTVEDVQAAIRFASQHNLKVVVKNTGHDYLGRSAAKDAFMIWTHNLKNITHNSNFIPEGGSADEAVPAMTLGAGVQWGEAYTVAEQNQRFILGGISTGMSVGAAGGWLMGGGHSAFSARYGLGVDNVVQITLVKANGDHVVANTHRNSELFWALRGGGAGSWGVITSVTYKTHDLEPLTMSSLNVTFSNPEIAHTVITEFVRQHAILSDAGWGGYSFLSNQTLFAFFVAPNMSWEETNNTIGPFFEFTRNATGTQDIQAFTLPFDNFHTWLRIFGQAAGEGGGQVGGNVELASRLISREAAEDNPEETARLLLSFEFIAFNFVAGGAVSRVDPASTALHPGWRKAVTHAYTADGWEAGVTPSRNISEIRQRIAGYVKRLDPISPDSATYMNEASLYEPDFRKSFFGSHYERLRKIKAKYDPRSLFIVAEGVGSEEWDGSLTCRT